MRYCKLVVLVGLLLVLTFGVVGSPSRTERVLVKFREGVSPEAIAKSHLAHGGRILWTIPQIGVQVLGVENDGAAVAAYGSDPLVEYVEKDFSMQVATTTPDDTKFGDQWGLTTIQAPEAWDTTTGRSDVQIAVLDSGIDQDHPELDSKIVANHNLTSSATVDDVYGHGTIISGIAAAETNNSNGVAGVCWGCSLMNVKIIRDDGGVSLSLMATGIGWAADNGAEVISISASGVLGSPSLQNAVNYAWNKGVVVAVAAGNDGWDTAMYPPAYTNAIAVAATTPTEELWSSSNYGSWVDVAAPGTNLWSTIKGGSVASVSPGTSFAAPFVSGLAGLLYAITPDSNGNGYINDEIRTIIESTADDIGVSGIGSGRINAYSAVSAVTQKSGIIKGTVTDSLTTNPIAGATVSDGTRSAKTDANGYYVIFGAPGGGTYTVSVSAGGYSTAQQTGVVAPSGVDTVQDFALTSGGGGNTAPIVDAGPGGTISEGGTFSSSGSFIDPDPDTWTATVNYGDGSGNQSLALVGKTFSLSRVYADNGTYTVTVTVNDGAGGIDSDTATVTVNNVAPVVDAGAGGTISEGGTFSGSGSFTDPGLDTWTATVNYGDGTGNQSLTLVGKTFSLSHVYADNGTYTVTVVVNDDDGGSDSDTATVTVNNVAPAVDAGAGGTISEGGTFSGSGSFTDPGSDVWTATVNYGDGSGNQSLALVGKTFSLSHVYAAWGNYTVTVTVNDDDGGSGSDTASVTVNPAAPTPTPTPTPTPIPLAPMFSAQPVYGNTPLVVQFTDMSTGTITSWAWDFDSNGTIDSTLRNPTHTFSTGGAYTVTLTVTGPAGSESLVRSNYLYVGAAVVPTTTYWGIGGLAGLLLLALVWRLRRKTALNRR